MNYPNQQPGHGAPRRKPNIFLLLMMGAMAMFLYTQYQKSKQQASLPTAPNIVIPDISNDGSRADASVDRSLPKSVPSDPDGGQNKPKQNASDWELDTGISSASAPSGTEAKTYRTDPAHDGVTKRGEWTLEEGDSTPAANPNARAITPSKPKSTRAGDWQIEEVDTKKN